MLAQARQLVRVLQEGRGTGVNVSGPADLAVDELIGTYYRRAGVCWNGGTLLERRS